jgi:hypothetical protein
MRKKCRLAGRGSAFGRTPSRIWLLVMLLLLVSLAGPVSAHASFSFAGTLSPPGQNAARAQVAVAPNGYAVFVWERVDETTSCGGLYSCSRIQVSARSPDGTFSPVQTLSAPDRNAFAPQVAVDSAGNAVIVWSLSYPYAVCCSVVQARARSAAGALSAVQTLSAPGRNSGGIKVQVDSKGNAVFAWVGGDGTTDCSGSPCSRIQTRTRSATGALSATQYLSPPAHEARGRVPELALAANGDAVFAWILDWDCCGRLQTRTRSARGTVSAVKTLTAPGAYEHAVGVDARGNAVFAWSRVYGTTECGGERCRILAARARSADGTLSPVQTISPPKPDGDFHPDVAVDGSGDAVFKWERRVGAALCGGQACQRIQARGRSAGGVLSPIQTLSVSGQDADEGALDVDSAGNAGFVWRRPDGTSDCHGAPCDRIQARFRSAAGALSAIETLSASGGDAIQPQVGVDPDGGFDPATADAFAVWERYDGTRFSECCRRIEAAVQIAPPSP